MSDPNTPDPGAVSPVAPATPPQAPVPPYAAQTPPAYQTPPTYPAPAYPTQAAPGYASAPGYATQNGPAYGAPNPYPASARTNVLAIVSMISSLSAFILLPFIGSIAGAIMGHISLGQIKRSGEKGRGMALAGVIVGWAGLALTIIGVISFIAFVSWASTQRFT